MSGEGKICITAGKTAGEIVRKTSAIRRGIGNICRTAARGIGKVCAGVIECPATTCKKLGNLCKTVKGKGKIARLEEKEINVFESLGCEAWNLYCSHISGPVFEQDNIKRFIEELEVCKENIQKSEEILAAQKLKMDRLAIFKRARANLESKNPRVRKVAILVLNKLGDKAAIPYLNRMLEDANTEVRERAAEVIHGMIDSSVEETLASNESLKKMNKMMDEAESGTGRRAGPKPESKGSKDIRRKRGGN